MTNNEDRKFRLNEILQSIPKGHKRKIEKERFMAQQCFKWGFSRRTMLEYMTNLITAGYVNVIKNDDNVVMIWL